MGNLCGKRALVTGASSGLGAHFARLLAGEGASVVIAARRAASLDLLANQVREKGGDVETLPLDVTDAKSVENALRDASPFDIIVNNAGIARSAAALDQSEEDWDAVLDTNLKGMFLVAQSAARRMREQGRGGSIVNVASILGLRQAATVLPYAVSKAGVIQMTKLLALEVARFGIRVNALAPGYLATDLNSDFFNSPGGREMIQRIPQRRLGELGDLDGPLMLLASDASRYMTGSVIVVDGGHLLSSL